MMSEIKKTSRVANRAMNRALAAVLVVTALVVVPTFGLPSAAEARERSVRTTTIASGQLPKLGKWDAHIFLESRLQKSFGAVYQHYLTDCRTLTPTLARCGLSWWIGDFGYSGVGYVSLSGDRSAPTGTASWRVRRFDFYCRRVQKRPSWRCTKTFRGKASGRIDLY